MNIILLGPPGARKRTLARRLVEERNMLHLSAIDLLRQARRNGTEMTPKVRALMDRGDLIPDELVINILRRKLETDDAASGCIFDDFPKTLAQADALDRMLLEIGKNLDAVIEMQVDDDALIERMLEAICKECSKIYNDKSDPIPSDGKCINCGSIQVEHRSAGAQKGLRIRLFAYYKHTGPLVGYYYVRGHLKSVNGLGNMDDIVTSIFYAPAG